MKLGFLILMAMLAMSVGLAACGKPTEIPTREVEVQSDSLLAPITGAAWHRLHWIMRIGRPEDRAHSDREARA
jgi:hypothetical protein